MMPRATPEFRCDGEMDEKGRQEARPLRMCCAGAGAVLSGSGSPRLLFSRFVTAGLREYSDDSAIFRGVQESCLPLHGGGCCLRRAVSRYFVPGAAATQTAASVATGMGPQTVPPR